VQGFSIISALCEWIAVFILAKEFLICRGNRHHFNAALMLFGLAIVANLITWATFGSYYRKNDLCSVGQKSFHDSDVSLSWAYGIRLIEFGVLALLLVLVFLTAGKGADRTPIHVAIYLLAVFLLMLTLLTTSGRGWMRKVDTGVFEEIKEWGLFDNCICQQQANNNCIEARRLITVVEVFSVVSIVFTFVLIKLLVKGACAQVVLVFQRIFSGLALGANLVVLITFTRYAQNTFDGCGSPLFSTMALHWAYGAICAALILQTLVFFGLLTTGVENCEEHAQKEIEPAN